MIPKIETITVITSMLFEINSIETFLCNQYAIKWGKSRLQDLMYLLAPAKSTNELLLEKVTKNNSKRGMVFLFFSVTKMGRINGRISVNEKE